MTLTDENQNNVLDEVVASKFQNLIPLLEIINKNGGIKQSPLRRESKFSMGKIYSSIKAIKTMKLAHNGDGFWITDLGRNFILTCRTDKKKYKDVLKESCLNAILFKRIYSENKDEKNPKNLFDIFKKNLEEKYKHLDDKFIGAVVRRYLEGIYDIRLRSGAGTYERKSFNKKIKIPNADINLFKILKENFNLSDANIMGMIESLPQDKKNIINIYLLSQATK